MVVKINESSGDSERIPCHVLRVEKKVGAVTKFRLLMWKNFLQQWRHRGQTVVELLLPVVTMAFVLLLRWQIEPVMLETKRYPPIPGLTLHYSREVLAGMNQNLMSFAYSPKSEILEEIVRNAATKLIVNNFDLFATALSDAMNTSVSNSDPSATSMLVKQFIKVDEYENSADLKGIYIKEQSTRLVVAAVEFDDNLYGALSLPNELVYSLRFPERPRLNSFYGLGGRSWRTDAVFPFFELPGPRFPFSWEGGNDPGYVNEMFVGLQHAISMEVITKLSGEDMSKYSVSIQRYPYPRYLLDYLVETLKILFPLIIMLSFSYTAVNIVRAITVEKELQLKETMKIMGLPTWLHWTAWFCKQFIFMLISALLIVPILKIHWFTNEAGFSNYAVFTNTPWTVLLFYITLYLTCTIFFCFMISGFFSKGSTAALFAGVIWFLTYIPAFLLGLEVSMSSALQVFTCLSLNSAMSYGFQLLLTRESTGGMQWGQFMYSPATEVSRLVFGHVIMMMVFNCVLYMLIALYLEQVMPGPFGTPKPWNFFVQKDYWRSRHTEMSSENAVNPQNNVIQEKDPTEHSVGVQMANLTKIYGPNIVVNNLTLNIYYDQITVLLGHNGAGKSTTISMLTGNLEATSGSIWVAGYDMSTQSRYARSLLGLCPQHNVLFNELTVREHLEFFARLKGFSGQEMDREIDSLIEKLELQDKRDYQAHGLSGGQKRRLSVGIALSGAACVVLLDEPTSGMDPASRRALWDLLQKEKKGRSMILTTHFMDEADILGDRVAIMAHGRLQCVGSPYFLKQHYGVGYTLVVVKDKDFNNNACVDLINKYIPATVMKEDRGTEVTFSLSNECSHVFQKMLNDLEANKDNIKFQNYGLVTTTMEDVFMSVGSEGTNRKSSNAEDNAPGVESTCDDEFGSSLEQMNRDSTNQSHGIRWQHVKAIWLKLWLVWSRSWALLALQLAVPILVINFTLAVMQYVMSMTEDVRSRELTLADGYTSTETLLGFEGTTTESLAAILAYTQLFTRADVPSMHLTIVEGKSNEDYYLERTSDKSSMGALRNVLLIGATFADNSATAWFSNFGYHDVPTSLAAVHAALLKARNPDASLTVNNHPLYAQYADQSDMQIMVSFITMQFTFGIGTSLGIVSAVFIMFYIKERICRAKLLQKAAGISPITMWLSAAVFDWTWFLIICIPIIISCYVFQVIGFSTAAELGRMYVCLMVYGLAMLPINYVFSYFFNGPAVGFVCMFFVNVLLGMMGSQIVAALSDPQLNTKKAADMLDGILQFFPLYSLVAAVRSLNSIGLVEWSCMQGCEYMAVLVPTDLGECTMKKLCTYFSNECCVHENPYWHWASPGVMRYLVCMLFTCIVTWIILMIAEYRLIQKVFNRERKPHLGDEKTVDLDVAAEAKHVETLDNVGLGKHCLVAKRLSKYYGEYLAVDQVSFIVEDTECFGLLGVNGAGKTTTFKMLMGDETISSGDAFVSGLSVKKDITKVHEKIGYCPQFEAVFEEMTGRETLRFFSMLRGLKPEKVHKQIEIFAQALGFYKHIDKRVYQYSGGNKRRLSTAVALLGRTRLLFVDEPTTGVDPVAKRKVWRAVQCAQRAGRGVVLTSHSMEECEALCSRLTIMVNGRFQCLGTPQHLKSKFSEGFTLIIKMKMTDVVAASSSADNQNATTAIKNYINSNFTNPKIMEEYQGLLTYYLPDRTMAWSQMFGIMETAKRDLEIEDYSISQTTLEQIFLQFTKYQREAS